MAQPLWFKQEQKQKMNAGNQHMEAIQNHLAAAQSSIAGQDHSAAAYHLGAAGIHANAGSEHYAKNSPNWIAKAIKKPGALTKQAKKAHETVQAFASSVKAHPEKHSSTTLKRANLAKTLGKMNKGK